MKLNNSKTISIIIPVLNEAGYIGSLLEQLTRITTPIYIREIICVDGGSSDSTSDIAKTHGATVLHTPKGRARQMNAGAAYAQGDVLYFLHADTLPPPNFDRFILETIAEGCGAGCFSMQFDTPSPFLRFFAWFTRFNHLLCRGGDQSLFVERNVFEHVKGFNEAYTIYEDMELIQRLYKQAVFSVLPASVITSARTYRKVGGFKLQFHFGMIHLKHYLGAGPEVLYRYYCKNVLGNMGES